MQQAYKYLAWQFGKNDSYFTLFLSVRALITPVFAEEKNSTYTRINNFSYSFNLLTEGEWIEQSSSLLNPENLLQLNDRRAEAVLLGETSYKGFGGLLEADFRLDYQYLQGSSSDTFDRSLSKVSLHELYYQTNGGSASFLAGRKKVRWGVGYAYSPTDLITQLKNPEDPDDRLGEIKGTDLVSVSLVSEKGQLDLIYFPEVNWAFDDSFILNNRAGMRLYRFFDPVDLSLVGIVDEDGDWSAGANTSFTLGKALELHAEYLYTSKNNRQYPDPATNPDQLLYPYAASSGEGFHDMVVGGQYTFKSNWNITLEYLYHSSGYTSAEFDAAHQHLSYLNGQLDNPAVQALAESGILEAASSFSSPQRKHYLFSRLYNPEALKSLSLELYSFTGIADWSGLVVFTPKYSVSDYFDIYVRLEKFWGGNDTEFGLVPEDFSAIAGISLSWGN